MVLILFLHAGQPATTTPFPPCAVEGGSFTKYDHRVFEFSFESQQAKRISARSGS
jgi:hypothetical protein